MGPAGAGVNTLYRSVPPRPLSYTFSDVLQASLEPRTPGGGGGMRGRSKTAPLTANAAEEYAERFRARATTRPSVIDFNGCGVKMYAGTGGCRRSRKHPGHFPAVKPRIVMTSVSTRPRSPPPPKNRAEQSRAEQYRPEQKRTEQNRAEHNRAEQYRPEQKRTEQYRAEQYRTEQNRTVQSRTVQNRAEQNSTEQSRTEQYRAEQYRTEQNITVQSRTVQNRAEQSRTEQNRAEQSRAEQSRTEQSRTEQYRAEQSRTEQNRVEQNSTEQKSTEQNRTEQSRTEQSRTPPLTERGTAATSSLHLAPLAKGTEPNSALSLQTKPCRPPPPLPVHTSATPKPSKTSDSTRIQGGRSAPSSNKSRGKSSINSQDREQGSEKSKSVLISQRQAVTGGTGGGCWEDVNYNKLSTVDAMAFAMSPQMAADQLAFPDVLAHSVDLNDLSELPRPKRILPRRDLPWVFRFKVKKEMNALSKIMASKASSGNSVAAASPIV
ncbi:hypothetical protein ACOMHN_052728 [Nucella lapillus]